jgi:hypothetical protein
METTEERAAHLEAKRNKDASTGKHANHVESCTNPYYRNRTHCRFYHEKEKMLASYPHSVSAKEDSSRYQ